MNRTAQTTTATKSKLNGYKAKPTAAPIEDEDTSFDLRAFAQSMGIEIPSGRQMLVGFLTQLTVGLIGGYAVMSVASYAAVGAVLLTGTMFFAWCAFILTAVIGMYMVMLAASKAGAYVAGGKLEEHAKASKDWVVGLFKREPKAKAVTA